MFNTLTRMGASGAGGAYEIDRSLRFNGADDAYLGFTPSSTGSQKVWTWSGWVKRTKMGVYTNLITCDMHSGEHNNGIVQLAISNADQLYTYFDTDGSNPYGALHDAKFRDPSAWYHIVWKVDAANTEQRIWVNGVEYTTASGQNPPDYAYAMNKASHLMTMGASAWDSVGGHSDLLLAEVHYCDGQEYQASDFGETDEDTGEWIPKKVTGLTYGTNGCYLKFTDNSNTTAATLGKDSAGSNNWTPNNFSVAADPGNDSLTDTPTNNYCTWNRIDKHRDHISIDNGALVPKQTDSGGFAGIRGTFGVTSGKWYYEFKVGSGSGWQIGWVNSEFNMLDTADVAITTAGTNGHGAVWDGRTFMYGWKNSGGNSYYPTSASYISYTTNDVIGCAMDLDNYKFYFAKNGTWTNSQDPTDGTNAIIPTGSNNDGDGEYSSGDVMQPYFTGWGDGTGETNFGQQGFTYTPPAGYKALCTANLSEPTIKKGSDHFNTVLYTGNGASSNAITGVGFQPDLVWIKARSHAYNHRVYDDIRGVNAALLADSSAAEDQYADYGQFKSFDTDGFTVGNGNVEGHGTNTNSTTHVAWNWKESASGGFDIVSYTGNGSARTISHSLGAQPDFMLVKNRDVADGWQVYHDSPGPGYTQQFDGPGTFENIDAIWNNTRPTSSVFSVGDDDKTNANGEDYIIYLWSNIEGYTKTGRYKGNGNDNGPFIFTGFKPAMVLIKCSSNAENWNLFDNKRDPDNKVHHLVVPNTSTEENSTTTARALDFLSNGIKIRGTDGTINTDDYTYVYFAFAETPFKYSNAR